MKMSKIGAAIVRDGKLLIVKESGLEKYGIPGGTIKPNETDIDCLMREIKEELSTTIKTDSLDFIGTFEDVAMNEPNKIIQIKLYKVELEDKPTKSPEIEDISWFGKNDDLNILGPIDKNYIIPALIEKGLLH